jgi:hypothetical protein
LLARRLCHKAEPPLVLKEEAVCQQKATRIERDATDDIGIKKEAQFYDFIQAAAAHTGGQLNYAILAADVEIY